MIYRIDVQITVPLNATEVVDRVEDCITNLFPNAEVTESPGELIAETHSMDHFADRLREQSIQATARDVFRRRIDANTFDFELKKQAAFKGVVNFSVGNPDELGDMYVRVRVEEPAIEEFIDHIAPAGSE
jgi:predicted RNA binding protein with dsRBD fold (UPF0201 family)